MAKFSLDSGGGPGAFWVVPPPTAKPIAFLIRRDGKYSAVSSPPLDPFAIEHSVDVADLQALPWVKKVHLGFTLKGPKQRIAYLELVDYERRPAFSNIYLTVRVDAEQPPQYAAEQAINLMSGVGVNYVWTEWVNKRLRKMHPGIFGDPDFIKYLAKLVKDLKADTADGRRALEEKLKLGAFQPPPPPA